MVDIFHTYTSLSVEPAVTPFCTELTGITDKMIDGAPKIETALEQLHGFLEQKGYFADELVFISCGDFDGN